MKIGIFTDNTLGLDSKLFVNKMNAVCKEVDFVEGKSEVRFVRPVVQNPETYDGLSQSFYDEADTYDLAVIATNIPYDNNYFFDSNGNVVIVAFNDWQLLTDLPIANGLAFFICSILASEIGITISHNGSTGCLRDFWWDKTGIDYGMRAAYLCRQCVGQVDNLDYLVDLNNMLDLICNCSRKNENIMQDVSVIKNKENNVKYDVFISHNSKDKPEVRGIVSRLKSEGITTWFDEEQLVPGQLWQSQLEEQISEIRVAAIFVGNSNFGPWHDIEMRAFISEFLERGCPVIPIILSSAKEVPKLPIFLKQLMWVDLRDENNFKKLVSAIKN
ncbi:toll/interleukin-1 receptor domain-containing protein [Vibrio cholerae]